MLRRARVRTGRILGFAGRYLWEFLRSNAVVVREIVTPGLQISRAIVEVPLRGRTRVELASMTTLITLTPGSLALELREDPTRLAVHGMHAADPDAVRDRLVDLEDRLLAALRPVAEVDEPPDRGGR